ncbi:MAG TPA: hypothetical protein VII06_24445 [Chloroflexota bacterium]|jgi:hypothetical protein
MRQLGIVLLLLAGLLGAPASARASGEHQSADSATVTSVTASQLIRQAGYPLTDAEAAYLDADQAVGQQYATAIGQVMALGSPGSGLPDATMQPALVAVLQRLVALDPAATPEAPDSLQSLRALAVEQRQAMQRAATAWLTALQAGDPNWFQAGADDFAAASQALQSWQQDFAARYPPPQEQP